ncbi:hypothetical protein Mal48_18030 [Thalassoglobus polymorphus]|uniref:Uncharacterized protein n=1 Tax=Thalassoglobus polymorphus TaxID=2527994 RepID=A0A517QLQ0_9PLAN|nr:hypothetical protein Mal48_18030 [Thalassoglobus polymorphus]
MTMFDRIIVAAIDGISFTIQRTKLVTELYAADSFEDRAISTCQHKLSGGLIMALYDFKSS